MPRPHPLAALAIGMASFALSSAGRAQDQNLPPLPPPQPTFPQPGAPPTYQPPPPPGRRPPPPAPYGVEVRFMPDEANVSLFSRSGQAAVTRVEPYGYGYYYQRGFLPLYTPLCDGPCTMRMVPGTYDMALSKGGGGVVPAHTPVVIQGPSALDAHYVDKSAVRVLGTVIGIAGTVGGSIMIIASVHTHTDFCDMFGNCFGHTHVEGGLMAGGIAVLVGSIVVGSILAVQRDSAHIQVTPLALAPMGRGMETPWAQGAALTLDF